MIRTKNLNNYIMVGLKKGTTYNYKFLVYWKIIINKKKLKYFYNP